MSWTVLVTFVLITAFALVALLVRRAELAASSRGASQRADARQRGSHEAPLQHPQVDLDQCIGCGACVRACPEHGVLELVNGQALVAHGARCVGHGLCAEACPVAAIAITLGDISDRQDLPALTENLEAVHAPGLFIAGELGGFALVRTAVAQGTAVADAIAARDQAGGGDDLDLLVVGAGPGGLACALRAKELGIDAMTIDQAEHLGGTVAAYPRRKMVMTQPVRLPLHGRLPRLTYQKEELIELWQRVVDEHQLDVRTGQRLTGIERQGGGWIAHTSEGDITARNVCLALGRRGTPRKLGIPGEDLPKVQYSLMDASSFDHCRVIVVGGGDSAIEAALGLAEQPGNEVTLVYRKRALFRLKARNDAAIAAAIAEGRVSALFEAQPVRIGAEAVEIAQGDGDAARTIRLPNDEVFVFAGGNPPFELLRNAGVSFDPADRPAPSADEVERQNGLLKALFVALALGLAVLGWALLYRGYYTLPIAARSAADQHAALRSTGPIGLSAALIACLLFVCNLSYLLRRSPRFGRLFPGSLRTWMSAHVLTGTTAFLLVWVHAAFAPRDTVGGHAFWACAVVVCTGAIGRYLYAFLPRAANGAVLGLEDLQAQLASMSGEWDRDGRGFGGEVRRRVETLIDDERARWGSGFTSRVTAIMRSRGELRRCLRRLHDQGLAEGVPEDEVRALLTLARRAHRLAWMAAHYEELRAVLGTWRYLHRWLALLLVLLAIAHIWTAMRFGSIDWSVLPLLGSGAAR